MCCRAGSLYLQAPCTAVSQCTTSGYLYSSVACACNHEGECQHVCSRNGGFLCSHDDDCCGSLSLRELRHI